eukprot:403346020
MQSLRRLKFRNLLLEQAQQRSFTSCINPLLSQKISESKETFQKLKTEYNKVKIEDVTVGTVIGGMRGLTGLLYETSKLHPVNGITYRGKDLNEIIAKSPKFTQNGKMPLPEAVLWLLLTGEYPNEREMQQFLQEMNQRSHISDEVQSTIMNLPHHMHPMTKLSIGALMCQPESIFAKKYHEGAPKSSFWKYTLEDSLNVCAKVPRLASIVYNSSYNRDTYQDLPKFDDNLDMAGNFCNMIGQNNKQFWELIRLYLVLHADHEGGTVSAHTAHCVNSALSDPYLSFAAAMNGLAGPLHGLANQEALNFLIEFEKIYGDKWTETDLMYYTRDTLNQGRVIPGYGHAVLRKTDPRFLHFLDFAKTNIGRSNLIDLLNACYKVIPSVLMEQKKIQNPWPNVDAGSGVLLMHYDMNQTEFYTVLFGMARALGMMSSLVWSRALNLPIERPNSITMDMLLEKAKAAQK